MSTQNSMLSIMNAALLAQGQEEILTLGNGTVEWRLLFRNWPLIVEAELEDGNYNFTREQAFLQTSITGKFGFDYGYLTPATALHIRRLWVLDAESNRIEVDWIQDSSYVYIDGNEGCYVEYLVVPDESLWTASFSRGIQLKLEALIAGAIKEEAGEKRQLEEQAEMQLQRARTSSSRSRRPQKPFRGGALSKARSGTNWRV